jgi:hypothetical protein
MMSKWIAIELAALAATTLVACVQASPPQGNGSSTMASSDGRAASAANPGGAPDCDSVCAHLLECHIDGIDSACPQQCRDGGYDQAMITRFQNASCEEIPRLVAQLQEQAQKQRGTGGGGGGGYHYCTAAGVYEVCDGTYCREQGADSSGDGNSMQEAQNAAVQECNHHMNMLVAGSRASHDAAVKQSCRVTSCK